MGAEACFCTPAVRLQDAGRMPSRLAYAASTSTYRDHAGREHVGATLRA